MKRLALFLLLLALMVGACAFGTPKPPGTAPAATSDSNSGQVGITFGSGPFTLSDPSVGLADLPNYTARLTVSFDGTRDGQAEKWTRTDTLTVSRDPAARMVVITASGSPEFDALNNTTKIEVSGTDYERRGDNPCTASVSSEGGDPALDDLAVALPGMIGADEAGSESVNGIEANQYTFNEQALGVGGTAHATGEVWVAAEGGYVVQYKLEVQGGPEYFGEGIDGTVRWDYDLDTSSTASIAVPDGCPAGLIDAPVMDDAQHVQKLPSATMYETASDAASVLAFYQQELPALGWQQQGEPVAVEVMTRAAFVQGDQQLTLIITPLEAGGLKVRLLLGKVAPASGIPGLTPTP